MKTWMKRVVPLFAFAVAPLAHAGAPSDSVMRDQVKDPVVVGAQETAPSSPEARDLRETVERLTRRVAELETKQEARNASLGDPTDHGGWW